MLPRANVTKALLAQLKNLREKHQQFRTHVKSAEAAVRAREEEVRKQNAALTQRVVELEKQLEQERGKNQVVSSVIYTRA